MNSAVDLYWDDKICITDGLQEDIKRTRWSKSCIFLFYTHKKITQLYSYIMFYRGKKKKKSPAKVPQARDDSSHHVAPFAPALYKCKIKTSTLERNLGAEEDDRCEGEQESCYFLYVILKSGSRKRRRRSRQRKTDTRGGVGGRWEEDVKTRMKWLGRRHSNFGKREKEKEVTGKKSDYACYQGTKCSSCHLFAVQKKMAD